MKRPIEWESVIRGKSYIFSYQITGGKRVLTVNGIPNTIRGSFVSTMIGFDEKFNLDGIDARLVIVKGQPDVVVDGVYVQSGEAYTQRPAWAIVFALACALIPIVSLGGAVPVFLGFGGATLCIGAAKSSMPLAVRVVLCMAIAAAAWILWFFIMLMLVG